MSVPRAAGRGRPRRSDLNFRNTIADKPDGSVYLDDERLDIITEKVISYMATTEPEDWSKDQWSLFKSMWIDRKARQRMASKKTIDQYSVDELKTMMTENLDTMNLDDL